MEMMTPAVVVERYKYMLWYNIMGLIETKKIRYGTFSPLNEHGPGWDIEYDLTMYMKLRDEND